MKKTEAIKLNREFRSLYYRGGSMASRSLVIYYRKNKRSINRLGLTVSKKIGKAVVRNHIKRLIKENYRLREDNIKTGYDIIFVARRACPSKTFHEIGRDMDYVLGKCGLFLSEKDNPETD
ncbi:MAG: ribonuclease P protein component [Clostridia bacterium]|nr:ribonuclease P protein component [Clostridia bacterium]